MALETPRLDPTLVTSACTLPRDCSGGVSVLLHSDASPRLRGFRTVGTTGVSSGSDWGDDSTRAGCGEEGGVEVGDNCLGARCKRVTFTGGLATDGAALFVNGPVTTSITNSTFLENAAINRGGVLFMQMAPDQGIPQPTTVIASSVLSGNTAASGGAAFLFAGTNFTAMNSEFNSNSARNGAVFNLKYYPNPYPNNGPYALPVSNALSLSNITAVGNYAFSGAFTYHDSHEPLSVECAGCTLSDNTQVNAGAVPITFVATPQLAAASGRPLPTLNVTMFDADGNLVNEWPDLVVSITVSNFTGLSGTTAVTYTGGAASFSTLVVSDVVGAYHELAYTLSSPTLTELQSLTSVGLPTGTVPVNVQPCNSTEVFDEATLRCRCAAGAFLNSESGRCEECSYGLVSSAAGAVACEPCATGFAWVSPTSCIACPMNSVKSPSNPGACACNVGFHDELFALNATSPRCAACPAGGVCTSGLVGAAEGYWRESNVSAIFYQCRSGHCLEENVSGPLDAPPQESEGARRRLAATPGAPTNCVDGNTGPLCGVCLSGYALQSGECAPCDSGSAWSEWSAARKGTLLAFTLAFAIACVPIVFCMPLLPTVEERMHGFMAAFHTWVTGVQKRGAQCKSCLTCGVSGPHKHEGDDNSGDASATVRHESLLKLTGSDVNGGRSTPEKLNEDAEGLTEDQAEEETEPHAVQDTAGKAEGSEESVSGDVLETLEEGMGLIDQVQTLVSKVQGFAKILVNFYQIASTFFKSLDVPWPRSFASSMAKASVINLNLVQLPKAACMHPNISFYTEFNGMTLGLLVALLSIGGLWSAGRTLGAALFLRAASDSERAQRVERFNALVLSRVLLLLYIAYPGVSVAIFNIFPCTQLSSSAFLDADARISCDSAVHRGYVGAGVVWVFLVPVGVPAFFTWLLYRFKVPQLARLKEDNALLVEAVQLAWTRGVPQPPIDMRTLSVDSIGDAHLRSVHHVLVHDGTPEEAADILSGRTVDEPDVQPKTARPRRRLKLAFAARVHALHMAIASKLNPAASVQFVAAKVSAKDACRAALIHSLLFWCRHSGAIALPAVHWEGDEEDDERRAAAAPQPESLRMLCTATLPALQARALRDVGFLISNYTTKCWYWESIELFRKLILTSVLALVAPRSAGQVVTGSLVALFALLANLRLRPYALGTLNMVNQIAQLNLFLLLFTALLLKVDVDGDSTAGFFEGIVSALAIVPIGLPIVIKAFIYLAAVGSEEVDELKDGAEEAADNADEMGFGDE